MKKVFFAFAACAFAINIAQADNNPKNAAVSMAVYKTDANAVKLIVVNEASENVTVRIRNAQGQVIHTDTVRKIERFTRKYVFASELPTGDYTIEVTNSKGVSSQLVTI